jgi:hypothetical protein
MGRRQRPAKRDKVQRKVGEAKTATKDGADKIADTAHEKL